MNARPSLELKSALSSDYEYAKRVHHLAYREMVILQFGTWDESVQDQFFAKSWNSATYSIVLVDEEPCGYCCIEEGPNALQLKELAIDPAKQRRGIGTRVLGAFRNMASRKDKPAKLNVMKTNVKARELYERIGFRIYGENNFQFLMRSDGDS